MTFGYNNPTAHTYVFLRVIGALAVLGTCACPTVCVQRGDFVKHALARNQLERLALALEGYRMDLGRYPTDIEGLRALTVRPSALSKWNGPYTDARRTPLLDPWGRAYIYRCKNS